MAKGKSPAGARRQIPRRRPAKTVAGPAAGETAVWLYGAHAVLAALANPGRRCHRLLVTDEAARRLGARIAALRAGRRSSGESAPPAPEVLAREAIAEPLPHGAAHQGLALLAEPLPRLTIEDLLAGPPRGRPRAVIVVLDQVTDPQNVGAVLRSAAAFGALGMITTERNAPPETGALAKAASGALEHIPYIRVTNLARGLEILKASGFWCLGLAAEARKTLAEADPGGAVALVLGAEGSGLRRLTRQTCDLTVRLPTRGPVAQLNVSNAAAIALYELLGRGG